MNKYIKQLPSILIIAALFTFNACKDDPALPDNLVQFESSTLGFTSAESEVTINIPLSREANAAASVAVAITGDGVVYGTDFTTTPAATSNTFTLPIAVGATSASFKLTKVAGVLFDGNEKITFTLPSADPTLVLGEKVLLTVNFAEILAAQSTMDINGGGATFPNRVFIDLSANRQTAVKRDEWDFGFYQVGGEFKVILNSSFAMMAKPTTKSDMNTVTATDSVGLKSTLSLNAFLNTNMAYIDDPAGDMTKTAIASISATDADNKVYIVNRGSNIDNTQRSWKKVRIIRNGTGYAIQHADIAATTFQTIQVTRNSAYFFTHVKLDNNTAVNIEPEKDKWDIAYGTFMNQTSIPPIPYVFNDIVLQNRNNVQSAELLIANAGAYEAFAEAGLASVTYGTTQINIGSKWRVTTPAPAAVRTDRFYLIKDAAGNVYKLKFTALTLGGERGKPSIEFALVKKGN